VGVREGTLTLVHLSDLHCVETDDGECIQNRFEFGDLRPNEWAIHTINVIQAQLPEAFVVITGDVTNSGTKSQMKRAAELFAPVADRTLMVPGNHDKNPVGQGLLGALKRFSDPRGDEWWRLFGPATCKWLDDDQSVFQFRACDHVVIYGIDSTRGSEKTWAQGEVSDSQLDALATNLVRSRRQGLRTVIAMHHHPFIAEGLPTELVNADRFRRRIKGLADLVLFGHKHNEMASHRDNTLFVASHANPIAQFPKEGLEPSDPGQHGFRVLTIPRTGDIEWHWHTY